MRKGWMFLQMLNPSLENAHPHFSTSIKRLYFFFQDLIKKVYGLCNENVLGLCVFVGKGAGEIRNFRNVQTLEKLSQTFYLVYMFSILRNLGLQHN